MCGIIGYVGSKKDVASIVLQALKQMEYRGYDSAGFCSVNQAPIPCFEDVDTINSCKRYIRSKQS